MATSAALKRLQLSAGRVLRHVGQRLTFRRYVATPNWTEGSQEHTSEGQPVVEAYASEERRVVSRGGGDRPGDFRSTGDGDRKVRVVETVLVVEVEPFAAHGGLTDDWRVVDAMGTERALANPTLNDDGTLYEVRYAEGGR